MKLSELTPGTKMYTQLGSRVLAVLSVGHDGYRVYVGAVPGQNHDREWAEVATGGDKQREPMARAIVENLFHTLEIDIPYAH